MFKMNKEIQAALAIMTSKMPPDTDPLFAYLQLQWDILNNYMFAGTQMRLLKMLFAITMKVGLLGT